MRLPMLSSLMSPLLSEAISDMRQRISTTSQEAVTGRHSDLTTHLNGRIGAAMLSQKAVEDISHQRGLLDLRENRLDIVQRNLSFIQDVSSGLDTRLLTAIGLGDEVSQGLAARDAESALGQIFGALNTRHGERYLFSGDATSTQPFGSVDELLTDFRVMATAAADGAAFETALDSYFNDPLENWQQSIYNGTMTSSDLDAVIGIDPAIVELITGLATMAIADPDNTPALIQSDESVLQSAAQKLSSGKTALVNLRAERGVVQEQIERRKESLDLEETLVTQAFNNLTARDQYEAAAELRELESGLEASYLLTSRLSNLSLLNYLR